jgi:hypothetical protein
VITRPAPPFQRAPDDFHEHHHHRGPVFVFVEPPFFESAPFGYPYGYAYPYSSSFYAFGPSSAYAAPSAVIDAPFFCWIDGIGFTDEGRFAHHLHEAHGVPLRDALAASELVGGRYVFFGF